MTRYLAPMTRAILALLLLGLFHLPRSEPATAQLLPEPHAWLAAASLGPDEPLPGSYGVEQTWTSRDKLYHFALSGAGAAAVYSGARWMGIGRRTAIWLSVGLVGAAGVVREVSDRRRPDKYFSEKDLLWNAAGIALGIAIPDRLLFPRPREAGSQ